jgi:hypothetical protein
MRHGLSTAAFPLLVLTILSLGCPHTDDNELSGTFGGVGRTLPPPSPGGGTPPPSDGDANVDGVWRTSTTVTFNDCGSRVPSLAELRIVDISQSDGILNAHVFDACGQIPIAAGAGTINGSTVSLSFTQEIAVSHNCTLRIHTVQSGSVENSQSVITGTSHSTISGLGSSCGSGLPCDTKANLLMERCPPASCTSSICP